MQSVRTAQEGGLPNQEVICLLIVFYQAMIHPEFYQDITDSDIYESAKKKRKETLLSDRGDAKLLGDNMNQVNLEELSRVDFGRQQL